MAVFFELYLAVARKRRALHPRLRFKGHLQTFLPFTHDSVLAARNKGKHRERKEWKDGMMKKSSSAFLTKNNNFEAEVQGMRLGPWTCCELFWGPF